MLDTTIYRLRSRDILTLCVMSLLCLGTLMVQSASMHLHGVQTSDADGAPHTLVEAVSKTPAWQWNDRGVKHLCFAITGLLTFLAIGRFDYRKIFARTGNVELPNVDRARRAWKHPATWGMLAAALCSLLVLIPHIGLSVNGARRWLPLGPVQVQPSELAKWAVVFFLAWQLTDRMLTLEKFSHLLALLVPIGAICLLVVIQDFGTTALIALCALTMLLVGRVKLWHLGVLLPPLLAAGFWFIFHKEYRWKRMTAFTHPYADPQGEGYHMIQSLLSFATGGVTGRGLGNGIQKLGYLPEDTTDFIFSVICEELGLFGALLTVALFLGILYVAWQTVQRKGDTLGRMLAFGIGSMIGLQAMINIAVATVSVPTKGLSLPLVSAGGSGLIITCAALGLLQSVARFGASETDDEVEQSPSMNPQPVSVSPLSMSDVWQGLKPAA